LDEETRSELGPRKVKLDLADRWSRSNPAGFRHQITDGLADQLADLFAPFGAYLRANYGTDRWDLTGLDDPLFYNVMKTEFGLGRSEAKGLTPRQASALFEFAHRCRMASSDDARNRVLAEVSELTNYLANLPGLEDSAKSVLKALRFKFPDSKMPTPVDQPSVPSETETEPITPPKPSVILGTSGLSPIVRGVGKDPLSIAQFDTIKALADAGERGLTQDALVRLSKHSDAVGIIDRLRKKDPEWASVIKMAGKPGGRYRIVP
jgi:hypothetical protein